MKIGKINKGFFKKFPEKYRKTKKRRGHQTSYLLCFQADNYILKMEQKTVDSCIAGSSSCWFSKVCFPLKFKFEIAFCCKIGLLLSHM